MDNDFKDFNNVLEIFSFLSNEEVMQLINATADLFYAGKNYFKLDNETINIACKVGNLPFLMWLEEKGLYPDKEGANLTSLNGHLDIIEWLSGKGYPF